MNLTSYLRHKAIDDVITSMDQSSFNTLYNKEQKFTSQELIQEENVLVEITEIIPLMDVKYYTLPNSQGLKIDFAKSLIEKDSSLSVTILRNLPLIMADVVLQGSKSNERWQVDSPLFSINICSMNKMDKTKNEENNNQLTFPDSSVYFEIEHRKEKISKPRKCAYWYLSAESGKGEWRTEGCSTLKSDPYYTSCKCTNLPKSIVLLADTAYVNNSIIKIASNFSICFCMMSIATAFATFLTYRGWICDQNIILAHISFCLFILELVFLISQNCTQLDVVSCSVLYLMIHYFFFATFIWTLLDIFYIHVTISDVSESETRWKWYCLAGYATPGIIVTLSLAMNLSQNIVQQNIDVCIIYQGEQFTWSLLGPVIGILLCNLIFIIITCWKFMNRGGGLRSRQFFSTKFSMKYSITLMTLLAYTWFSAFFWVWKNTTYLGVMFITGNVGLGGVILFVNCSYQRSAVHGRTNNTYSNMLCCRLDKDTDDSTSYSNKLTSFTKPYLKRTVLSGLPTSHSFRLTDNEFEVGRWNV